MITTSLLCSGTNILMTAYRDRDDAFNYIAAGGMCVHNFEACIMSIYAPLYLGVTGGVFRLSWGVMPTIGGTVLGLLVRCVH